MKKQTRTHKDIYNKAILILSLLLISCGTTTPGIIDNSTSTPNSNETPTVTSTAQPSYTYDFENGTDGWGTSEAACKEATVKTTASPVYSGSNALEVDSELLGDASQAYANASKPANCDKTAYLHTEAAVYFPNLDLTGKTVSCHVYFPPGLVSQPVETYYRLFVKDSQYKTSYSAAINIAIENTNMWDSVSLKVGQNEDPGFQSQAVHGLGLRVETNSGSTLNYTGPFYVDACIIPPSSSSSLLPTPTATQTATTSPTATMIPTATATPLATYTYDFENGTEGWGTSEGAFKKATVSITTSPVYSLLHSLEVTSELLGDASQAYAKAPPPSNGDKTIYLHTEAAVYFSNINLTGKTVSCHVSFPTGLINRPHETYFRLFVKDSQYKTSFSTAVNIAAENTNSWQYISFTVGQNADPGFNSQLVHGFGLRVETNSGSTLDYTGPFYIDACLL